jgi:cytochrome P450/malonyl CoA-acyl carrier protein transacylase
MIEKLRQSLKFHLHRFPLRRHSATESAQARHRLLFVFPGRAGQWPGMGQQLYREEPVFREAIQRCSRVVEERLGWSLDKEFTKDKTTYRLHDHKPYVPIALSAIQLGLCELWRDRGIEPDSVIGFSAGEFAAAYAAGGLTFEDAMILACGLYGPAQQALVLRKKLIFIRMSLAQAESLCQEAPAPLFVLTEIGPSTVVLTWNDNDTKTVTSFLKDHGIQKRALDSDSAFHTPLVERWKAGWLQDLRNLKPLPLSCACYSSANGNRVEQSIVFDGSYWWMVLSRPVLYASALRAALADGHDTILFISANPVLTESVVQTATLLEKKVETFCSMRSDVPERVMWENSRRDLHARGFGPTRAKVSVKDNIKATTRLGRSRATKVGLNLLSPQFQQNPYFYYHKLRRLGPVHYLKKHRCWIVLNYADVAYVFQQPHLFSSSISAAFDPVLLGAEPDAHNLVRRVVAPYFSSQGVSVLAQDIAAVTQELLATIRGRNNFDFMTDFAVPLPLMVLAKWLGIDSAQIADLKRWVHAVVVTPDRVTAPVKEFINFCAELAASRIRAPGSDLLSQLIRAFDKEKSLTTVEAASFIKLLLVAGTATTGYFLGNAVLALLRHPQVLENLRAERHLIPLLIEEALRYDSVLQTIDRITTDEVEIGGTLIPAGAKVTVCLGAANRDPQRFLQPDNFELMRNPRNHLAFGTGFHRCLGERLARLKTQIALEALLTELPLLHATRSLDHLEYVRSITIRGLEHLMLTCK